MNAAFVGIFNAAQHSDLHPALTTVRVPYEELGRRAVRTALDRIPDDPDEHLLLGTHAVVRNSAALTPTHP
ncbi:substrate-binding domain-containing protein [Streptomyces europaeiscabiei]|uniref:substrate-binding domain-containing protein n=1 Tax=Streptomyces europaeiscabiei TaxID=146819 RepID=UPI0038D35DB3